MVPVNFMLNALEAAYILRHVGLQLKDMIKSGGKSVASREPLKRILRARFEGLYDR
jgi:hypothetical protein